MVAILGTVSILLIAIIVFQLSRSSELLKSLKGEEPNDLSYGSNRTQAILLVVFLVLGLVGALVGYLVYADRLMFPGGMSASEHGANIDSMFLWTSIICGIAFLATQILLFFFAYKYRARKGHKAEHFSHDNKLEVIWTTIPAIVLTILVAMGIENWYKITDPAPADAQIVEVIAEQFKWNVRYPGADADLGKRDFQLIDGFNSVGIDWEDENSHDDFLPNEIHLIVGKPVLFKLGAKDVLHSFYLPHFRLKMDCVPGIPTQFWMTPTTTTAEMRKIKNDPEFNYELACAELCGRGHWNMRYVVVVEEEAEYTEWLAAQTPYYDVIKDQLKASNEEPAAEVETEEVHEHDAEAPAHETTEEEPAQEEANNNTNGTEDIVSL